MGGFRSHSWMPSNSYECHLPAAFPNSKESSIKYIETATEKDNLGQTPGNKGLQLSSFSFWNFSRATLDTSVLPHGWLSLWLESNVLSLESWMCPLWEWGLLLHVCKVLKFKQKTTSCFHLTPIWCPPNSPMPKIWYSCLILKILNPGLVWGLRLAFVFYNNFIRSEKLTEWKIFL